MDIKKRNINRNQKHILVTDGERNFLHSMEFILESAGYKVSATDDGQEAIEMIMEAKKRQPFDLLITDITMKGLTGLALLDRLKELNICMPTFVLTSYGDKNLLVKLLRRGCCEYLEKPVDETDLIKRVRSLLINNKTKKRRDV